MFRPTLAIVWCAVLFLTTANTEAQIVPRDLSLPANGGTLTDDFNDATMPVLRSNLIRPEDEVNILFDALLDPSGGTNPSKLTAAAKSIIMNHKIAQQQVELVIQFLNANRESIIAGRNADFNRIFGKSDKQIKVAVLSSSPLPGTFNLVSSTVLQARPQQQQGGGNNQRPRVGNIANSLRRGETLFLDNTARPQQNNNVNLPQRQVFPNLSSTGFVVKIAEVIDPNRGQGGGGQGGGGNNNQNTDILLDPSFSSIPMNAPNRNNLTAWRVVGTRFQNESLIFDQVLATYLNLRTSLSGVNLNSTATVTSLTPPTIVYNRGFRPIADVRDGTVTRPGAFDVGDAIWGTPSLNVDAVIQQFLPGRQADRLVRQAGFSLSDSHYHLDRLADFNNSQATDFKGRPVTPLLWTEDNEFPLAFPTLAGRSTADRSKTDFDRAFFHDRQTIFGDPTQRLPGVTDQYIGRAFLEETLLHAGDFLSPGTIAVAANNLEERFAEASRPQRSTNFVTVVEIDANGNVRNVIVDEIQSVPESGTPTATAVLATDGSRMRRWQMIIESFAEWGLDLNSTDINGARDIAAIGLLRMAGVGAGAQIRASDAESYALFADVIRIPRGGVSLGIDFTRVEPLGKRGIAGFNPVVPAN